MSDHLGEREHLQLLVRLARFLHVTTHNLIVSASEGELAVDVMMPVPDCEGNVAPCNKANVGNMANNYHSEPSHRPFPFTFVLFFPVRQFVFWFITSRCVPSLFGCFLTKLCT